MALLAAIETGLLFMKAAKQLTPLRSRTCAVHSSLFWKGGEGCKEY
jgi:hypothetical protein